MDWFREEQASGHEGFIVRLLPDSHGWRTLGSYDWDRAVAMQVACDCGWRSPRFAVPQGTVWDPCLPPVFDLSLKADAQARSLWERHMQDHGHIELSGDVVDLAQLAEVRAT